MTATTLIRQPPFPWFGGKRRVAPQVWTALGDVANYVEPFAGSLAVLLHRPDWHRGRIETVNDLDGSVTNFWRAMKADPAGVAGWADNPVNEIDLTARQLTLVGELLPDMRRRLLSDPTYFDVKIAGWWVWGLACWIGGGWCGVGSGPWLLDDDGVIAAGEHGCGVSLKRPQLGNGGQGVNRDVDLVEWFEAIAARLRRTRICSGDWQRVVTDGALTATNNVGVFLDPPYLGEVRDKSLYVVDDHTISHAVRDWALNADPKIRIVLAGYIDEHDDLMPDDWERVQWTAGASYKTSRHTKEEIDQNRNKETLWCSPACNLVESQARLF